VGGSGQAQVRGTEALTWLPTSDGPSDPWWVLMSRHTANGTPASQPRRGGWRVPQRSARIVVRALDSSSSLAGFPPNTQRRLEPRMSAAIIDCFMFFNEFDVLELRLHELEDVVDRFVLVEANRTHAGEPKPYYFLERRSEFSEFADRITVVQVDDLPVLRNRFVAEVMQRNAIVRGLTDADDDDLVIISDIDEVPRAAALSQLHDLAHGDITSLVMDFYNYALNLRMPEKWYNARVTKRSTLRYMTPQEIRRTFIKNPDLAQHGERDSIPNGGWHYSCLASREDLVNHIRTKAQAFSHAESDHPDVINDARLEDLVAHNQLWWDASFGSVQLQPVPIDDSFPGYIVANPQRWAPFITDNVPPGDTPQTRARHRARAAAGRIRRAGRALRGHEINQ
jgi:beta-1,4-mannosyl-glycoprotein beta-1,4-N-acetylglucosaminyltransferase